MNANNAQSKGYEDARRYFLLTADHIRAPKEELLRNAENRAFYSYGVRAKKTVLLYVKGYEEGMAAHEAQQAKEREDAARRAAIQHNPNTRFCCCAECSK